MGNAIKFLVTTLCSLAAAAAMTFGTAQTAHAQTAPTTTFAQFTQAQSGSPFTLTNNGSSSVFTTSNPVAVNFYYLVDNNYHPGVTNPSMDTIAATMTITGTVDGAVTGTTNLSQSLKDITITFTANNAVNGKTNLLTITSYGAISGRSGRNSGSLKASTPNADAVTFSSDFLYFTNTVDRNLAISLSSIFPTLGTGSNGSYLNGFTSSASGTFASNPPPTTTITAVPEPGVTVFALVNGVAMVGMVIRRRIGSRSASVA